MIGDYFNPDYKLIDDYFKLKEKMDKLEVEIKPLRNEIKKYMIENNMDEIRVKNYTIELKSKYVATQNFINLLKENNLHRYIV